MESLNEQEREREARQAFANREELAERIARTVREDGTVEPLRGLYLKRVSSPTEPVHGVSIPAFCVIAQGSKEIYLGEDYYRYDPGHYLLATVELPIVIQIGEASTERPHLSLRLNLEPAIVGSVMVEAGLPSPRGLTSRAKALDVSPLDVDLQDAVVRLVRLVDSPTEARAEQGGRDTCVTRFRPIAACRATPLPPPIPFLRSPSRYRAHARLRRW